MKKHVKIGLIGLGTVGSGVQYLVEKNRDLIKQRTNIDIILKSICDLRIDEIEKPAGTILTKNWRELVNDPEIDIIVELIGGIEPAKTIIRESLKNGKSVVTANKKLLAEEGDDLFSAADKSKTRIEFEASVGGGIPCILSLKSGLVGNKIDSVIGILNGTTNYILTRMEEDGLSFNSALKEARRLGFAEADPTFDIEGYDAAHKISILSMLAYNRKINYSSISKDGIKNITELDIEYAHEMGYVIKLLGISKLIGDKIDIRVHPTMLHRRHPLASVRNEFNAVMFMSDMTGPIILFGRGAGSHPTASAVVSDIVQIAGNKNNTNEYKILHDADYIQPDERISRYYMRIHTEDKPGILSRISGILGNNNISIASVIQKEMNSKFVPLVIMTHKAGEGGMIKSVQEINSCDFVEKEIMLMRVEETIGYGE